MLKLLVAFTTYDGQIARIAERIASILIQAVFAAEVCDLARSRRKRSLEDYAGLIAGGPLHGGRHSLQLFKFVSEYGSVVNEQPSAFFSARLSAAGYEEQQGNATRCANESLEATNWQPDETTIVAGALLYQNYGFFKRWMMKVIIQRGGTGDTDTSRNCAYTDWGAVDDFANDFAGLLDSRTPKRAKQATH